MRLSGLFQLKMARPQQYSYKRLDLYLACSLSVAGVPLFKERGDDKNRYRVHPLGRFKNRAPPVVR
jgi:hypothetical protein